MRTHAQWHRLLYRQLYFQTLPPPSVCVLVSRNVAPRYLQAKTRLARASPRQLLFLPGRWPKLAWCPSGMWGTGRTSGGDRVSSGTDFPGKRHRTEWVHGPRFLTCLLIRLWLCCQPIRCQVGKSLWTIDFNLEISYWPGFSRYSTEVGTK